jgi:hypothetical protein
MDLTYIASLLGFTVNDLAKFKFEPTSLFSLLNYKYAVNGHGGAPNNENIKDSYEFKSRYLYQINNDLTNFIFKLRLVSSGETDEFINHIIDPSTANSASNISDSQFILTLPLLKFVIFTILNPPKEFFTPNGVNELLSVDKYGKFEKRLYTSAYIKDLLLPESSTLKSQCNRLGLQDGCQKEVLKCILYSNSKDCLSNLTKIIDAPDEFVPNTPEDYVLGYSLLYRIGWLAKADKNADKNGNPIKYTLLSVDEWNTQNLVSNQATQRLQIHNTDIKTFLTNIIDAINKNQKFLKNALFYTADRISMATDDVMPNTGNPEINHIFGLQNYILARGYGVEEYKDDNYLNNTLKIFSLLGHPTMTELPALILPATKTLLQIGGGKINYPADTITNSLYNQYITLKDLLQQGGNELDTSSAENMENQLDNFYKYELRLNNVLGLNIEQYGGRPLDKNDFSKFLKKLQSIYGNLEKIKKLYVRISNGYGFNASVNSFAILNTPYAKPFNSAAPAAPATPPASSGSDMIADWYTPLNSSSSDSAVVAAATYGQESSVAADGPSGPQTPALPTVAAVAAAGQESSVAADGPSIALTPALPPVEKLGGLTPDEFMAFIKPDYIYSANDAKKIKMLLSVVHTLPSPWDQPNLLNPHSNTSPHDGTNPKPQLNAYKAYLRMFKDDPISKL